MGKKILVVDDKKDEVRPLLNMLESDPSYESIFDYGFNEGLNVLDRIEIDQPDLVILDIDFGLGQETLGIELLKKIKTMNPALPIMMFSVHGSDERGDELYDECRRLGAFYFIDKEFPIEPRLPSIKNKIKWCLKEYASRKEKFELAQKHWDVEEYQRAFQLFSELMKDDVENTEYLRSISRLYWRSLNNPSLRYKAPITEVFEKIKEVLLKVWNQQPNDLLTLYYLAVAEFNLRQFDDSVNRLQEVWEKAGGNTQEKLWALELLDRIHENGYLQLSPDEHRDCLKALLACYIDCMPEQAEKLLDRSVGTLDDYITLIRTYENMGNRSQQQKLLRALLDKVTRNSWGQDWQNVLSKIYEAFESNTILEIMAGLREDRRELEQRIYYPLLQYHVKQAWELEKAYVIYQAISSDTFKQLLDSCSTLHALSEWLMYEGKSGEARQVLKKVRDLSPDTVEEMCCNLDGFIDLENHDDFLKTLRVYLDKLYEKNRPSELEHLIITYKDKGQRLLAESTPEEQGKTFERMAEYLEKLKKNRPMAYECRREQIRAKMEVIKLLPGKEKTLEIEVVSIILNQMTASYPEKGDDINSFRKQLRDLTPPEEIEKVILEAILGDQRIAIIGGWQEQGKRWEQQVKENFKVRSCTWYSPDVSPCHMLAGSIKYGGVDALIHVTGLSDHQVENIVIKEAKEAKIRYKRLEEKGYEGINKAIKEMYGLA